MPSEPARWALQNQDGQGMLSDKVPGGVEWPIAIFERHWREKKARRLVTRTWNVGQRGAGCIDTRLQCQLRRITDTRRRSL